MDLEHTSVLLKEAVAGLKVGEGEKYIDATIGLGGHAREILKLGGRVLGIDLDSEVLSVARKRLKNACPGAFLKLIEGNFSKIGEIGRKNGFGEVAGVLFDLGVGSYHFDDRERGFSFESEAVLDMRMDKSLTVQAVDLINGLTRKELDELFSKMAQEKYSGAIAKAIISARSIKPIRTCRELADLIAKVKRKHGRIHPATKVFMALRIVVNDELNNLKKGLAGAEGVLKKGGRLVVISFHSGEDRIVKNFFNKANKLKIITKKPIEADKKEVRENRRARGAKLRIAEKI